MEKLQTFTYRLRKIEMTQTSLSPWENESKNMHSFHTLGSAKLGGGRRNSKYVEEHQEKIANTHNGRILKFYPSSGLIEWLCQNESQLGQRESSEQQPGCRPREGRTASVDAVGIGTVPQAWGAGGFASRKLRSPREACRAEGVAPPL